MLELTQIPNLFSLLNVVVFPLVGSAYEHYLQLPSSEPGQWNIPSYSTVVGRRGLSH